MSSVEIGHLLDMEDRRNVTEGKWWHFTRYEIRSECIVPAKGARLVKYDPWERYRRARRRGRGHPADYEELANLLVELRRVYEQRMSPAMKNLAADLARSGVGRIGLSTTRSQVRDLLQPHDEAPLLEWCNRNGLLGVLPHESISVIFRPLWNRHPFRKSPIVPTQTFYVSRSGQWEGVRLGFGDIHSSTATPGDPVDLSVLAPGRNNLLGPTGPVGWIRMLLDQGGIRVDSIEEWRRHFPGQTTEVSPPPLSAGFWRLYVEWVYEFLAAAEILVDVVGNLTDASRRTSRLNPTLQRLLAPTATTFIDRGKAGPRTQWVCGSLLSAYTLMAIEDAIGTGPMRPCPGCAKLFVPDRSDVGYCSNRCRWRQQKRRHRERKPPRRKRATRTIEDA